MDVVSLGEADIILSKLVHYLCQITVDGREDGHPHAEVAGPEKRLAVLFAVTLHVGLVVLHPASGAADHLHVVAESLLIVVKGGCGVGELDGDVGRGECGRVEILLIVDIDDAYNLMATLTGYLLNHMSHLAVAYQCYFHIRMTIFTQS